MEHLEGKLSVLAALEARRRKISVVLVSDSAREEKIEDVIAMSERRGVPVKRIGAGELDKLAHGRTHGGVVALCTKRPESSVDEFFREMPGAEPALLLILEGVDDARNLGFTLRSADALGAHGVVLKKHVWDFDGVDVSRTSSGAFERLPLLRLDSETEFFRELRRRGASVWGTSGAARKTIYEIDLRGPVAIAIGGEKRGLSGAVRKACDGLMKIPMREGATSLAMSHAAAIALAEARRQRSVRPPA